MRICLSSITAWLYLGGGGTVNDKVLHAWFEKAARQRDATEVDF